MYDGERREQVLRVDQIVEVPAVVADRHAEAVADFVLHRDVEDPLVRAADLRIERLILTGAEVPVAGRPELVFLRDVVVIEVGPRAHVCRDDHGVVRRREAGALRLHVRAERALDCRLSGAEQIPRHAEPRRDILPAHEVRDGVEVPLGNESSRRNGLLRNGRPEVIEAQPRTQRQTLLRPRVLHVETEIGVDVVLERRRRVEDGDLRRDAVAVLLVQVAVDARACVALPAESILHADFQRVRTRDVRQRRDEVMAHRRHELRPGLDACAGVGRDRLRSEHQVRMGDAAVVGAGRAQVVQPYGRRR